MGQDSALVLGLDEFGATPHQPPQQVTPTTPKVWIWDNKQQEWLEVTQLQFNNAVFQIKTYQKQCQHS